MEATERVRYCEFRVDQVGRFLSFFFVHLIGRICGSQPDVGCEQLQPASPSFTESVGVLLSVSLGTRNPNLQSHPIIIAGIITGVDLLSFSLSKLFSLFGSLSSEFLVENDIHVLTVVESSFFFLFAVV